jgi:hypothetical protein
MMDDFHLAMISELIKARDEVETAEAELKELKAAVAYFEEVFSLSGESQFKNELGTVSIGEIDYAYVSKRDFAEVDPFLQRVFDVPLDDFFEATLTLTNQKKLAKLLATKKVKIPESIKIFSKPTIRLRKKK